MYLNIDYLLYVFDYIHLNLYLIINIDHVFDLFDLF